MKIDDKECNLVCAICLNKNIAVGAFHSSSRPSNFFEHHHKTAHNEAYRDVITTSPHPKTIEQACYDGNEYITKPELTKDRVTGKGKEKLDRQLARLIISRHLPTRLVRYDELRSFLVHMPATTKAKTVYIPCARTKVYKCADTEMKEIKSKIIEALEFAKASYHPLRFITCQFDGWSSRDNA